MCEPLYCYLNVYDLYVRMNVKFTQMKKAADI